MGLLVFLPFAGLVWLVVRAPFHFRWVLVLGVVAFFALFGLNLFLQNLLGRSDQEGFFYAGLRRLSSSSALVVTLGIPGLLLLDVLLAFLSGAGEERTTALGLFTAWLVWILHIGVHEAGHLAAARAANLHPFRIIVGPLELRRRGERWRPVLCREWFSLLGGLVETGSEAGGLSPEQQYKFAAGGPLATILLLGALLYWNPYSTLQILRMPPDPKGMFFSVGILYGLLLLFINLLPSSLGPGGLSTDGYQMLAALRRLGR